ncbi:hypothetical protein BDZ89DRAFT_1131023 [Hymenopellis radicata]|nr:hypothetical protein BDZ89DRAFT_1131023 [Hymenopellis radicata]
MDISNDLLDMSKESRPAEISSYSANAPLLSLRSPTFYDTTRAPIDTLPNEVLSLIFRILARHPGRTIHSGLEQCVVLLKVCRHWHALIMNDGFLWSFIETAMWGPREWDLKTYHRVQNQVKRARNCPLHISHHSRWSLFWIEDLAAPLMN